MHLHIWSARRGVGRGAAVDCGSIIVGPCSQVAVNNLVALDLAELRHHGDVVVGSYKAAVLTYAEASGELKLCTGNLQFQLSDGKDGLAQVLRENRGIE